MKYKVWLEKQQQMATKGISLKTSGVLMVSDEKLIADWFGPGKRAEKFYGYFLQQLPMLAAPWSSSELYAADKTFLYVGDIITDEGGCLYVVVLGQYGSIRFIYSDTPDGNFVIGCPWDNIGDNVIVHGNVFENGDLVTNTALLNRAMSMLETCKLEIK